MSGNAEQQLSYNFICTNILIIYILPRRCSFLANFCLQSGNPFNSINLILINVFNAFLWYLSTRRDIYHHGNNTSPARARARDHREDELPLLQPGPSHSGWQPMPYLPGIGGLCL